MRRKPGVFEKLESRHLLTVAVELVADIRPGQTGSNLFSDWVVFNDEMYFSADDGSSGRELWKTDGTAAGTTRLKDIASGEASSSPSWMTEYNGELYFSARTPSHGAELWKTDGSSASTRRITDINSGDADATPFDLAVYNGELIFTARDGDGDEMWKTQGTAATTTQIADILEGPGGSVPASFSGYFEFNGVLYFNAEGPTGDDLYRSDGKTVELVLNADNGDDDSYPFGFTEFKGDLYFLAETPIPRSSDYDVFLYRVDGETGEASLFLEKNIDDREGLIVVGDKMYFAATDDTSGMELHVTDGTTVGTRIVREIMPADSGSNPRSFFEFNGKLYFAAGNQLEFGTSRVIHNLWTTDGTLFNTRKISTEQIDPNVPVVAYDGEMYYRGFEDANGWELYSSNGVTSSIVADLNRGQGDSLAFPKIVFEDQLLYLADDGRNGMEVWTWDGETNSMTEVYLGPGDFTEAPESIRFERLGNDLIFNGQSPFEGIELFAIRGTQVAERLPGDANEDSVVNFADFLILSTNFGNTDTSWSDGDFDGNSIVDFADFLILSQNFGRTAAASPSNEVATVSVDHGAAAADAAFENYNDDDNVDVTDSTSS